ncbi:N-acetyltransferase [Streptomyces bottropensis]|uniref:N-acetyltransferase n=1 Tax=Streptomyces bottropensis TaxID=42235 RepID=UPI0036974ADB
MWQMPDTWPEFMCQGLVGGAHMGRIPTELPDYVLVATDGDGAVVAKAFSVPFALNIDGRRELPARGWDQVMVWAFLDLRHGRQPDTVSAIEIHVAPPWRGKGVSGRMVAAMRDNARRRGFSTVVAPVRPSAKEAEPETSAHEYAFRVRPQDGLPHDPWLRVHVRAGGKILAVAPVSMTVSGSLEQWREWTGLPFHTTGPVTVPGALVPVQCVTDPGYAVYVEPNVWVRHDLTS